MSELARNLLTIDAFAASRGLTRRQVTYRINHQGFPFVEAAGEARTGPGNGRLIDCAEWDRRARDEAARGAPGKLQLQRVRRDITTENWRSADAALVAMLTDQEYTRATRDAQRQQYRVIQRARDIVRAALAREAGRDGLQSDIR